MQSSKINLSKGDIKIAITAYQNAVDIAPDDGEIQDKLIAAWEEALKKNPLDPDNHICLGKTLQLRDDFRQGNRNAV